MCVKQLRFLYSHLAKFLNDTRGVWGKEVIQNYPNYSVPFNSYKIEELLSLSEIDLFKYAPQTAEKLLLKDSVNFYLETEELLKTLLQSWDYHPIRNLPIQAYQNLTPKKRHELSYLCDFLEMRNLIPSKHKIVDFCGGAGYLSRTLAFYFQTKTLSLDNDLELQERGKQRHSKFIPVGAEQLEIKNLDLLSNDIDLIETTTLNSPFIGIHACAHLLDSMLIKACQSNAPWILGVGCCYYKSTDTNYHLSQFAKNLNFNFSSESLLLASRGHDVNFESFEFSLKVKRYRYLTHILLKNYYGIEFRALGKAAPSTYSEPYINFALEKLPIALGRNLTDDDISIIHQVELREDYKIEVARMIICNFIRTSFAKKVELLIAIDRALFLAENGYEVELVELFEPTTSPRNIGIFGTKS